MKLSPHHPFLPKSQCPVSQTLWVSAEEEGSHLLGAQPTRRQSGGAMGWAEGKGEKKGKTRFFGFFFFYILHREGYLQAGGSLQGHFLGTTRAQVPFPLPQFDPCPSCPQEGFNPPQSQEAGQSGGRKRACVPLFEGPRPHMSEGDGHLGNPSRTGACQGMRAWPTPHLPNPWEGDG